MEAHPLKCTWLDQNDNRKQKAISLYIPDFFTDDNKKTPDKDLYVTRPARLLISQTN
jgi:hypothetical protein